MSCLGFTLSETNYSTCGDTVTLQFEDITNSSEVTLEFRRSNPYYFNTVTIPVVTNNVVVPIPADLPNGLIFITLFRPNDWMCMQVANLYNGYFVNEAYITCEDDTVLNLNFEGVTPVSGSVTIGGESYDFTDVLSPVSITTNSSITSGDIGTVTFVDTFCQTEQSVEFTVRQGPLLLNSGLTFCDGVLQIFNGVVGNATTWSVTINGVTTEGLIDDGIIVDNIPPADEYEITYFISDGECQGDSTTVTIRTNIIEMSASYDCNGIISITYDEQQYTEGDIMHFLISNTDTGDIFIVDSVLSGSPFTIPLTLLDGNYTITPRYLYNCEDMNTLALVVDCEDDLILTSEQGECDVIVSWPAIPGATFTVVPIRGVTRLSPKRTTGNQVCFRLPPGFYLFQLYMNGVVVGPPSAPIRVC